MTKDTCIYIYHLAISVSPVHFNDVHAQYLGNKRRTHWCKKKAPNVFPIFQSPGKGDRYYRSKKKKRTPGSGFHSSLPHW